MTSTPGFTRTRSSISRPSSRLFGGVLLSALIFGITASAEELQLWYRQPAKQWVEALPVGNGRLGAMVFGGVTSERLQLNEDTLWEGYQRDGSNPAALKSLPEIRRLLFEGKNNEAAALAGQTMMGIPVRIKSYQPLGDLLLETPGTNGFANYRRELDLDSGIAAVRYEASGATYTREVFASAPDNVIAVKVTCDQPRRINLDLTMARERDAECVNDPANPNRLILRGRLTVQYTNAPPRPGLRFEGQVVAIPAGGKITGAEGRLAIRGADSVVLLIAGATDYRGIDPNKLCREFLDKVAAKQFEVLRTAHVTDHRRLFRRVGLDLGIAGAEVERMPTDERLKRLKQGEAYPGLVTAYFQYGRTS